MSSWNGRLIDGFGDVVHTVQVDIDPKYSIPSIARMRIAEKMSKDLGSFKLDVLNGNPDMGYPKGKIVVDKIRS